MINIYQVVPVHAAEMDYKLRHGADALITCFNDRGVSEVTDPDRPSAVA